MQKGQLKNTITMVALCGILIVLCGVIFKDMYTYYRGPDYVVDTYIKQINQRKYGKLYHLVDTQGMFQNKDEMTTYYKKIYEKENKLLNVQQVGKSGLNYEVVYQYKNETQKKILTAKKVKGNWYVNLPFQAIDVQVFAPFGSTVYLDSQKMTYTQNECYELKDILPGNYLLKVEVSQEGYKDYYKILQMPQEKAYVVPYEVAHLTVQIVPGFTVQCNQFYKKAQNGKAAFEDLLLGNYTITVADEAGIFVPQVVELEVTKGENKCEFGRFELSATGERMLNSFLNSFYSDYIKAIEAQDVDVVGDYFIGNEADMQRDLFSSWYIDQKDIQNVEMQIKKASYSIDESGYIHMSITESAQLENEEIDESGSTQLQQYKLMITWETVINPLDNTWKIVDRIVKQSIVAVQDQEGRWVQY